MSAYRGNLAEVTGLVVAGAEDGTGFWNENHDIGAPVGATGVCLWIINTLHSARWVGVRQPGKNTPHLLFDVPPYGCRSIIVPAVNGRVDILTEATTTKFFTSWFPGPQWGWFDIDKGLPSIPSTANQNSEVTAPHEVPAGAVALAVASGVRYAPAGSAPHKVVWGSALIPLNASNAFTMNSSEPTPVIGYCTGGIEWAFDTPVEAVADSAWRQAGASNSGAAVAILAAFPSNSAYHYSARAAGSTFDGRSENAGSVMGAGFSLYAPLSEEGRFDYWVETGEEAPDLRLNGWIADAAQSGGTDPDPAKTKKLKLSGATAVKEVDGSGAAVNVTHTYDHGILYSGDPFAQSDETRPTVLATFADVAVVDGECELTESDCLTGSVDALPVGASTRYLVLKDADSATGKFLIYPNVTITEE